MLNSWFGFGSVSKRPGDPPRTTQNHPDQAEKPEPVWEKLDYQLKYLDVVGLRVEERPRPAPEPSWDGGVEGRGVGLVGLSLLCPPLLWAQSTRGPPRRAWGRL